LFVAFDLSDEAKEAVSQAIVPWRERFPKARWVPSENWHVTLVFLGQTWPRLRSWVQEQVEEAAFRSAPTDTALTHLGAFPTGGKARVLWAGLDDSDGGLTAVATALADALAREFTPERRPYAPHLTVARSDPPLRLPEGFAETQLEPVVFRVDRITLFWSHLQRPAPRYEALASFGLGTAR
jgi:2'-5' RNA ligase